MLSFTQPPITRADELRRRAEVARMADAAYRARRAGRPPRPSMRIRIGLRLVETGLALLSGGRHRSRGVDWLGSAR